MFDDQPQQGAGAGAPPNLPIAEPVDMFAGADAAPVNQSAMNTVSLPQPGATALPPTPQFGTALGAGVLTPVSPVPVASSPAMGQPVSTFGGPAIGGSSGSPADNRAGDYSVKEPTLSRGIMTIIIIVVVVIILGGGGWWIYNSFISVPAAPENQFVTQPSIDTQDVQPEDIILEPPLVEIPVNTSDLQNDTPSNTTDIDTNVLFGEPIDTDGDGLDDVREDGLGTDSNDWDTDNDELSDGDEVIIWKTDPLNPDSDGDSYKDGDEVRNGYNPAGPGKFFEPPTGSTVEVSDATSRSSSSADQNLDDQIMNEVLSGG